MIEDRSIKFKNILQDYILYLVHCTALMLTQGKMFFGYFGSGYPDTFFLRCTV